MTTIASWFGKLDGYKGYVASLAMAAFGGFLIYQGQTEAGIAALNASGLGAALSHKGNRIIEVLETVQQQQAEADAKPAPRARGK